MSFSSKIKFFIGDLADEEDGRTDALLNSVVDKLDSAHTAGNELNWTATENKAHSENDADTQSFRGRLSSHKASWNLKDADDPEMTPRDDNSEDTSDTDAQSAWEEEEAESPTGESSSRDSEYTYTTAAETGLPNPDEQKNDQAADPITHVVGSFPTSYAYGEEGASGGDGLPIGVAPSKGKPRILLMGMQRSGKSSIQKVVFHKMTPNETLYLESTNKIVKDDMSNTSFIHFEIWDLPGQIDFINPESSFDCESMFANCGALIFVIDSQDHYQDALSRLKATTIKAFQVNPAIKFEVFIHKVDGLTDDIKMDTQREIHQRSTDSLAEAKIDLQYSYYLTSIYDHSIFEAFSKVVQKLIPNLSGLEHLLNIFIQNSAIEKAFLFDVASKIYIATDSSIVDMQSYELCCDMIDVVFDVAFVYATGEESAKNGSDRRSAAVMKMGSKTVLYLREVNRFLSLICILREEGFVRRGAIDYNFQIFKEGALAVFELEPEDSDCDLGAVGGIPAPLPMMLRAPPTVAPTFTKNGLKR